MVKNLKIYTASALRSFGILSGLLLSIVVARRTGAENTGIFYFFVVTIGFSSLIGRFGLDHYVLREISWLYKKNDRIKIGVIVGQSITFVFLLTILVTSVSILVVSRFSILRLANDLDLKIFFCFLVASPFYASIWIFSSIFKSIESQYISNLLESMFIPFVTICSITIVFLFNGGEICLSEVSLSYLIGCVVTFVIAAILYFKKIGTFIVGKVGSDLNLHECFNMMLISLLGYFVLWAPSFLMGVWVTGADVGVFRVCLRIAMLTTFIWVVINGFIAPKVIRLYKESEFLNLRRLLKRTSLFFLIIGVVIIFGFAIGGKYILGIFGEEFVSGYSVLLVLAIGQSLSMAMSSYTYCLITCGEEKYVKNVSILIALATSVLSCFLIPRYGCIGAASVSSITNLLYNSLSLFRFLNITKCKTLFEGLCNEHIS